MTATRDMNTPRPMSQHRMSGGTIASSLPSSRQSRTHTHSLSVGSLNPAHRVTRRKSMSSTAANNVAAMAAAVKGSGAEAGSLSHRRTSKSSYAPRGPNFGNNAALGTSLPNNGSPFGPSSYGGSGTRNTSAVTDGPPLAVMQEAAKASSKTRVRRASEGSRLSKGDAKRSHGSELKCETCGKGYKHSSCLTKHLWEHTPEWAFTSKLLISKHQQVQLLEAASVLVAMNQDGPDANASDHSSASPAASGSSENHEDDMSSVDTTPPPHADDVAVGSYSAGRSQFGKSNRYSATSSAFSQSYQSGPASSVFSESAPNGQSYMAHYRQWSADGRPATAATSATSVAGSHYEDEEQADLAAAVGLLSCSYGTPKTGPSMLPPDVPPVPPLPARFMGQKADAFSGSTRNASVNQRSTLDHHFGRQDRDVEMDEDNASDDDFDRHSPPMERVDEDEEGVFGTMEE